MTQPNGSSLLTLSKTLAGAPYNRVKDCAATHGIDFGMAVQATYLDDAITGDLIANECNIIVPEYEMQPNWMQPSNTILDPEAWHYTETDQIAAFATAHGQRLKCHSPVFGNTDVMPAWMETILATPSEANARAIIENTVQGLARYTFASVDGVNEPISTTTGAYKTTSPYYVGWGGPGYIDFTMQCCRDLLPGNPQIGINENGLERQADGAGNDSRRAFALTMVDGLADQSLIDYLGCQCHIESGASYQSTLEQTMRSFFASVRAMGVLVHLTEGDYKSTATRGTNEELDAYAQDRLKRIVGTWAEDMRDGEQLILWGVKDDLSWLQDPANNGGITQQRPLPWDSNGNPKTMERMLRRIFA